MHPTGCLRDSAGRSRRGGGWLVEDGVQRVRLFQAPIWCPSGGAGTREAGGTVAESLVGRSSALWSEHVPDPSRAEGSSIVDEPGKC